MDFCKIHNQKFLSFIYLAAVSVLFGAAFMNSPIVSPSCLVACLAMTAVVLIGSFICASLPCSPDPHSCTEPKCEENLSPMMNDECNRDENSGAYDCKVANDQLDKAKEKWNRPVEDLNRAEDELNSAKNDWNKAKNECSNVADGFEKAREGLTRAKDYLEQVAGGWNKANNDLIRAKDDWNKAKNNWNRISDDENRTNKELAKAQEDWNNAKKELNTSANVWNKANGELRRAKDDWCKAKQDFNKARDDWNRANSDLNKAKQGWDQCIRDLNEAKNDLKKANDYWSAACNKLNKESNGSTVPKRTEPFKWFESGDSESDELSASETQVKRGPSVVQAKMQPQVFAKCDDEADEDCRTAIIITAFVSVSSTLVALTFLYIFQN